MNYRRFADPRFCLAKVLRSYIGRRGLRDLPLVTARLRLMCTPEAFPVQTRHGFTMMASPREYESHRVFFFGEYDLETSLFVRWHLGEGRTAWDVGSADGWFTLLMGKLVGPGGRVDAFEAHPPSVERTARNAALNGMSWVRCHHGAVGARSGAAWFLPPTVAATKMRWHIPESSGIGHTTAEACPGAVETPALRLDDFAATTGLARLDFVKLDIEGAELQALRGAEAVLGRFRPTMLVEYNSSAMRRQGSSVAELDSHLAGLGYERFLWRGQLVRLDLYEALSDPDGDVVLNVICLPTAGPGAPGPNAERA